MGEVFPTGIALSVGFYIINPANRDVMAGPYRTRLAARQDSGVVEPCCIMEVVGDWVSWNDQGGTETTSFLQTEDGYCHLLPCRQREDGKIFEVPGAQLSIPVEDLGTPIMEEASELLLGPQEHKPGCWVPFDGIKSVELQDGRTVEPCSGMLGSPDGFPDGWIGMREVDHPSFAVVTASDVIDETLRPISRTVDPIIETLGASFDAPAVEPSAAPAAESNGS